MNRKTIYIAGQMAGLPDNNFPAFFAAEKVLRSKGWEPINPARFNTVFGTEPTGRLLDAVCESERAAIPHLDAIYLLKGWENSKGAKRELEVALHHDLMVVVEESEERKLKEQSYDEMIKTYGVKPIEILVPAKQTERRG